MKTFHTLLLFIVGLSMALAQDAATETAAGLYNDALAKLKAKEWSEAVDLISKSIEIADPAEDAKVLGLAKKNGSIGSYYKGNDLLKEEKFDEAMASFKMGLEWNPNSYTCAYGIAKSYDDQDRVQQAVTAYIEAAEIATTAGKADRAERYMSRAGNIVGLTYGDKNYDDAIAAGENFLANQEDADVRYYVAKALAAKGQSSDALEHAKKAFELGGMEDEGKYQMLVAESLEATGNKSAAAAAYAKVTSGKYAKVAKYKADELTK